MKPRSRLLSGIVMCLLLMACGGVEQSDLPLGMGGKGDYEVSNPDQFYYLGQCPQDPMSLIDRWCDYQIMAEEFLHVIDVPISLLPKNVKLIVIAPETDFDPLETVEVFEATRNRGLSYIRCKANEFCDHDEALFPVPKETEAPGYSKLGYEKVYLFTPDETTTRLRFSLRPGNFYDHYKHPVRIRVQVEAAPQK